MLAHGTIRTLLEVRDGGESAHGSSVRVMGVLESFDPDASRGVIAMDGASLAVDVSLVPGADPHRVGSMYQYIGEVDMRGADRTLARVARCVDGAGHRGVQARAAGAEEVFAGGVEPRVFFFFFECASQRRRAERDGRNPTEYPYTASRNAHARTPQLCRRAVSYPTKPFFFFFVGRVRVGPFAMAISNASSRPLRASERRLRTSRRALRTWAPPRGPRPSRAWAWTRRTSWRLRRRPRRSAR